MGHDITPIGNHKLYTKYIKVLAEDICSRIDINIEYGYWGQENHFKLLGENKNEGNIVLGKIIKNKNFKTFKLTDDSFQLKQLHEKYGDSIFYNPEYWDYANNSLPEKRWIDAERKRLIYPSFELADENDDECLYIYKELYSNKIPYFSRWWSFCEIFTESHIDHFEPLNELFKFRKELMKYTLAFGGDKIYYLDDQSKVLNGVGQGGEWDLSWHDFEKFVADKSFPLMLNIPQFITDKDYRKEFIEKKAYPLSFIDDFSDIK